MKKTFELAIRCLAVMLPFVIVTVVDEALISDYLLSYPAAALIYLFIVFLIRSDGKEMMFWTSLVSLMLSTSFYIFSLFTQIIGEHLIFCFIYQMVNLAIFTFMSWPNQFNNNKAIKKQDVVVCLIFAAIVDGMVVWFFENLFQGLKMVTISGTFSIVIFFTIYYSPKALRWLFMINDNSKE